MQNSRVRVKDKRYFLALIPFLILIIVYELVPLVTIIGRSFLPEGGGFGFTLEHYISIFTKKLYQTALINSFLISTVSAVVGLIVAFFAAKAADEASGRVKSGFISLLNMCSNFSGIPLAFSYIIILGNAGILTALGKQFGIQALAEFPLYSVWGLLLVYIYFQIPLATMLLIPAFEGIRKEWKEAVSLLGGSGAVFWKKVGIPTILPSIMGSFTVLFANAIAAYATAYAMLQNNFSLLPIRISEQFVGDIIQRKEFGSALAVVLMLFMAAALLLNSYILKRRKGGTV